MQELFSFFFIDVLIKKCLIVQWGTFYFKVSSIYRLYSKCSNYQFSYNFYSCKKFKRSGFKDHHGVTGEIVACHIWPMWQSSFVSNEEKNKLCHITFFDLNFSESKFDAWFFKWKSYWDRCNNDAICYGVSLGNVQIKRNICAFWPSLSEKGHVQLVHISAHSPVSQIR